MSSPSASPPPFGSVTAESMAVSRTARGEFGPPEVVPTAPLTLHPATHALHYGSSCFEGLKAHRGTDGVVRLFRAGTHAERFRASAAALCLPVPPAELVLDMVRATVEANATQVPDPPGALYVRPMLLGMDANVGAAAVPSAEALLCVVASPVGSYFAGGERALTVAIETELPRSTPQFGAVKTGANYAMALGTLQRARAEGADQVLFAPGGDVQETGASNVVVVAGDRVIARPPDGSILAGVTRDSVVQLARHLGLAVEERAFTVHELMGEAPLGEVALSGTAAVLTGVGTLVHDGVRVTVGDGGVGAVTRQLRDALYAVQRGESEDRWGWTEEIGSVAPS